MIYHTLFCSKIRKDVSNLSSAAVVIGALRNKIYILEGLNMFDGANLALISDVDEDK